MYPNEELHILYPLPYLSLHNNNRIFEEKKIFFAIFDLLGPKWSKHFRTLLKIETLDRSYNCIFR